MQLASCWKNAKISYCIMLYLSPFETMWLFWAWASFYTQLHHVLMNLWARYFCYAICVNNKYFSHNFHIERCSSNHFGPNISTYIEHHCIYVIKILVDQCLRRCGDKSGWRYKNYYGEVFRYKESSFFGIAVRINVFVATIIRRKMPLIFGTHK